MFLIRGLKILIAICQVITVAIACNSDNEICDSLQNDEEIILLSTLEDDWKKEDKIFFIETSGRDHIPVRYACAAESAAKQTGVEVIILLTSPILNNNSNNATRNLLNLNKVHFRYLDPLEMMEASEFGDHSMEILKRIHNENNRNHIVQLGDALRLAVVYNYGGWYADFDTIFMKSLERFKNSDVISTDNYYPTEYHGKKDSQGHDILGTTVSNGIFHFAKPKSPFLQLVIQAFIRQFNPKIRSSGGSHIMTAALKEYCNFNEEDKKDQMFLTVQRYSKEKCSGIQLYHPKYFFPASWYDAKSLFLSGKSRQEWLDFAKDAYSMDFYLSSANNNEKVFKQKYYGQAMPAYTVFGEMFCPMSFNSVVSF